MTNNRISTKTKKFDLVIFDLDGTLIDNREAIRENFNYALESNGYAAVKPEDIDTTIGRPLEDGFMQLVPGIDLEIAKELTKSYRFRYKDTSDHGVILLDGVPDVLVQLRNRGIKLAIATTKMQELLIPLLTKIDLIKYFDVCLGRTLTTKPKPDPEILNTIIERLQVRRENTAMVGDTEIDIFAGKNANVYTIAVLSGVRLGVVSKSQLEDSKPDLVIDSLKDLPKIIL